MGDSRISIPYRLHTELGSVLLTATSYTGPGDLFTFSAWYGLRGYSRAKAALGTTKAIRIADSAGGNSTDIFILTNGSLASSALNAWITSFSTAYITTWYDQTGNGWDVNRASTLGPYIVQNVLAGGTLPVAEFSTTSLQYLVSANVFSGTITQPLTHYGVSLASSYDPIIGVHTVNGTGDNPVYLVAGQALVQVENYAGVDQSVIGYSTGHYHQYFCIPNGSSAKLSIDGAAMSAGSGTGNSGSNSLGGTSSHRVFLGLDSFAGGAVGRHVECGFSSGDQSAFVASLYSNITGFYGTLP